MPTDHPPPRTSSLKVRILWLVGVHVLVGLLLGAVTLKMVPADPYLVRACFVGLVFSQASLLGVWAGAETHRWWIRLVGISMGVGCLGVQFGICIEVDSGTVSLVGLATVMVSAVLLLARCFGFRTRLDSHESTQTTRLQFSIRHLIILTLVVACLLALARWQKLHLDLDDWLSLALFALPFATVGFVAVCGVLGTKHPLMSLLVLLAVAVGAGYGLEKSFGPGPGFAIGLTATLTEALSLAVSLFVVRSCGYRLRRRTKPRPETDSVEVS